MPGLTVYFTTKTARTLDQLAQDAEKAGRIKNTSTLIAADIVDKYIDEYKKALYVQR